MHLYLILLCYHDCIFYISFCLLPILSLVLFTFHILFDTLSMYVTVSTFFHVCVFVCVCLCVCLCVCVRARVRVCLCRTHTPSVTHTHTQSLYPQQQRSDIQNFWISSIQNQIIEFVAAHWTSEKQEIEILESPTQVHDNHFTCGILRSFLQGPTHFRRNWSRLCHQNK